MKRILYFLAIFLFFSCSEEGNNSILQYALLNSNNADYVTLELYDSESSRAIHSDVNFEISDWQTWSVKITKNGETYIDDKSISNDPKKSSFSYNKVIFPIETRDLETLYDIKISGSDSTYNYSVNVSGLTFESTVARAVRVPVEYTLIEGKTFDVGITINFDSEQWPGTCTSEDLYLVSDDGECCEASFNENVYSAAELTCKKYNIVYKISYTEPNGTSRIICPVLFEEGNTLYSGGTLDSLTLNAVYTEPTYYYATYDSSSTGKSGINKDDALYIYDLIEELFDKTISKAVVYIKCDDFWFDVAKLDAIIPTHDLTLIIQSNNSEYSIGWTSSDDVYTREIDIIGSVIKVMSSDSSHTDLAISSYEGYSANNLRGLIYIHDSTVLNVSHIAYLPGFALYTDDIDREDPIMTFPSGKTITFHYFYGLNSGSYSIVADKSVKYDYNTGKCTIENN